MNYTTQIIKVFDEINEKILKLTKGDAQLCDYDNFKQMLEMWIIPDHIDGSESDKFMSDFMDYLQYKFEDELEGILDNLKDVSEKIVNYKGMSNIEIFSDISKVSLPFQDSCELSLYNIRLKLSEE